MLIERISLSNFRNIERADIDFGHKINILYGANGQGKTNILEAVFYAGTLKSFRHVRQADLISWQASSAILRSAVVKERIRHNLAVEFEAHRKQLEIDGKHASRAADFCSAFSVVAFSPDEMQMVSGSPELRRRYLDRAIFSSSPDYLKIYQDYYRNLKQRNQLLKMQNYAALDVWTDQLVITGTRMIRARIEYVAKLATLFRTYYSSISASDEKSDLCYDAKSLSDTANSADIEEKFRQKLTEFKRIERERCITMVGPHRDDLGFYLNDRPISLHGSQGQQKSFVLALKMAEIEYLKSIRGEFPVLLLDDMTAELDRNRTAHLVEFMLSREMQVIITTTDPADARLPETAISSMFHVENGKINSR